MVSMFKIEDFGHVLAIAFSVSAIFYFVDFRERAIESFEEALVALRSARLSAEQKFKDAVGEQIGADRGRMFSLAPRTEEVKKRLAVLEQRQRSATVRWGLLGFLASIIAYSHITTNFLAVLSTGISLGSLIYSGFHPHDCYGWTTITLILVLSFLSIVWNVGLYLILMPKLTKGLASPSISDRPTPTA
jgi:hypothetical protein